MLTVEPTAETLPLPPSRMAMVWLTIAVLTGVFYFIEHMNTQVSRLEAFSVTADELAAGAAEGNAGRRLAITAIGLFGALLLLRRDGRRLELRSRLGWLLLGYLVWCGISILWSDNLPLTLRRVSALSLCSVGALGIARQVTLRDLCLIALAVSTILVVNSVGTEIALGTFHPFSPEYRFAGTLHPNVQAPYCATMALAAGFLASRAKRGRILLWTLCAIGVVLLALTKSRTACGAVAVGLLAYGSLTASWPKIVMVGAAILGACCALALAVSLLGGDIERQMTNVALIGRQEQADSLSGRIPLWAKLTPYLQNHFLLGHGYQTFWSPQRIESFSESCEWAVPDGHSAYLDAILDLGIIGAAIYVVTILTGICALRRHVLAGDDYGCGFFFTLLVYRSLSAFLESACAVPTSFVPFIMVCGLIHLGFCGQLGASPSSKETRHGLPLEANDPKLSDV